MNTTINTLIFFFLVLAMGYVAPLLDEDHSSEHEVAKAELAKQRQQDRFERAAREMCGNGVALMDAAGAVRCEVRKALKAGRVKL